MQAIALENNLSETAFVVKEGEEYRLRWFMPTGEIDLCGHATLATAFVILNYIEPNKTSVTFNNVSGKLLVTKQTDLYEMDFPLFSLKRIAVIEQMEEVIGVRPVEAWLGRDLVCIMENETQVFNAKIDLAKALALEGLLLHITAKGSTYDCVTRTFAPKASVSEDPVCGSGHCHIIPFWADRFNKDKLVARQASSRGGTLYCSIAGDRVKMAGRAVLYATAELHVDDVLL